MTGCELLAFVPTAWFQMTKDERSMNSIPWMQYIYLTLVLAITQGSGLCLLLFNNQTLSL
jgi:hypothetical protein